jgi:hypothetical protein
VAPHTRVFGEVMTMSHGELEIVRESRGAVREGAPVELFRRMSRAVFGNLAWSRYPAAQ